MPLIVLFLAISAFAQAPQWIEESWRYMSYPKSEWYTGFAMDKISGQPDLKKNQAIEKEAQNKLSESIVVQIQGVSTTQTASQQMQNGNDFSETINTGYSNIIRTSSNTVLAKVDVKSYFDKQSGYIYAFAAVKKKDLADFYRSNISSLFSFAEKEFIIAEQLAEQGRKNIAFTKVQAIEDSLKNVSFWGSLLQTAESDNSYAEKEKALWQKVNNVKMQLQNSTAIYLDISGNERYSDMDEQLGTQMQEKGCNCTIAETIDKADYLVTVKTKLNNCIQNNNGMVYCYANANATVNNFKYKKPVNVKIPQAKGGWINGNKDKATEEAFKELTNSLAEKIVQTINQ